MTLIQQSGQNAEYFPVSLLRRNSSRKTNSSASAALKHLEIEDEFDIIKTLADGYFSKVILVRKSTDRLVLKAIHSNSTLYEDFLKEVEYNYFLSPHPNVVKSFNVTFFWNDYFVFVQEFAPYGNLSRFIKSDSCGLVENHVKLIVKQLSSALEFMHSVKLVHRDIKLENILVFKQNFSQIKLCDFGSTRSEGSLVRKTSQLSTPFSPPEVCQTVILENYYTYSSSDVWQLGILLIVCLTGIEPWQCADITDAVYCQYTDWLKKKSLKVPENFQPFTPRLVRLLKRLLEPKPKKRCEIREICKYLEDEWIRKGFTTKRMLERHGSSSTRTSKSRSSYTMPRRKSVRFAERVDKDEELDYNSVAERVGQWVATTASNTIKAPRSPTSANTFQL